MYVEPLTVMVVPRNVTQPCVTADSTKVVPGRVTVYSVAVTVVAVWVKVAAGAEIVLVKVVVMITQL